MFLAMYSSFAQEESISISKNCRMGIRKRMEDGTYINPSVPYGYNFVDGKAIVNQEEAEIVKLIFSRFLQGMGVCNIAYELNSQKIPFPQGSKKWHHTAIMYILRNPKYIGDAIFHKKYTTDTLPFRTVRNKGEKPMYYVKNTQEPIISKETFASAQKLIEKRKKEIGREVNTSYPLSKKVYCGECGTLFRRKARVNNCSWVCRNHDRNKDNCDMKPVLEKDIYNAFIQMYNKLTVTYKQILLPLLKQLQALSDKKTSDNEQIITIRKETAVVKEQYHLMTQLKNQGILDAEYFTARSQELNIKLSQLQKQLRTMTTDDEFDEQIEQIKDLITVFEEPNPINRFDEIKFDQTVERITFISDTEIKLHLKGGITLTDKIQRKGRTRK